jgi:uncharacterized membrane protein YphA (DoxX/SURF4 family)
MKRKNLIRVTVFLYAGLFLYSSAAKFFDLPGFKSQLEDSPLSPPIVPLLVWLLPLVEFLVSVFLLIPRSRTVALVVAFSLLVVFSGYLLYLTQYTNVSCACGGWLERIGPGWHLALNFAFILLGGVALRNAHAKQKKFINAL